jgi:iron complex transport system substrate-binding protein
MMQLAGATNAADFNGYKPLTSEALLSIAPEVVITMRRHGASDNQALLNSLPGYKESPAGKTGRLIEMDAHYLLGFGPRTHEAALDLMSKLYPDLAK